MATAPPGATVLGLVVALVVKLGVVAGTLVGVAVLAFVAVGGTLVLVGGALVAVGGTLVLVGGTLVAVGATRVGVCLAQAGFGTKATANVQNSVAASHQALARRPWVGNRGIIVSASPQGGNRGRTD
jgi:hypothetical protein